MFVVLSGDGEMEGVGGRYSIIKVSLVGSRLKEFNQSCSLSLVGVRNMML